MNKVRYLILVYFYYFHLNCLGFKSETVKLSKEE